MKQVCLFHFPRIENFHGYSIDSLDPLPYFPHRDSMMGRDRMIQKLGQAGVIDQMYRDRYPPYMRFLGDFVDKFSGAELLILANYNPVHPEVLRNELKKPIKVLGFVDDPVSTYVRGLPYLWVFDGAFYVSPSYNERLLFKDALGLWGCQHSCWFPWVPPKKGVKTQDRWPLTIPRTESLRQGDGFFTNRDLDLIYVGQQYGPKVDRLIQLRKRFGSRLGIYGRWALAGFGGLARGVKRKPILWTRVRAISDERRTNLYYRTKIGINMHFSDSPTETGNMRMYEVPAHGMMLLCDKAALNAHEQIFQPGKEAVFYDSIEDAIDKIDYYLEHDEEREGIARAGFARVHRDYDGESGLKRLLDWASALPRKTATNAISCELFAK